MEITRKYDLSELSESILKSRGTYALMVDIDHMMQINDEISHEAGDAAIAATASRIGRSTEPGMTVFRTGGDEFVVITNTRDAGEAEAVAKKIISFADEDVKWNGGTFKFTLSVGVARIPESGGAEEAMKAADAAMYKVKKENRGGFHRAD